MSRTPTELIQRNFPLDCVYSICISLSLPRVNGLDKLPLHYSTTRSISKYRYLKEKYLTIYKIVNSMYGTHNYTFNPNIANTITTKCNYRKSQTAFILILIF
jgi:hypothetical protein